MTKQVPGWRRRAGALLLGFGLLLGLSSQAAAQTWSGIVPNELSAGAKYRILFVTQATYSSNRAGRADRGDDIEWYNGLVQAAANGATGNPFAGITFKVLGSTGAVDARDNTGTNPGTDGTGEPIYYYQGQEVAGSYADLYDGIWDSTAPRNENGATFPGGSRVPNVSTGSTFAGLAAAAFGNTRAFSRVGLVQLGRPKENNRGLNALGAQSGLVSLYALSEVLTGGASWCRGMPSRRLRPQPA